MVFQWDLHALDSIQGVVAGLLTIGAAIVLGFTLFDLGSKGAKLAADQDDYDEYMDNEARRQSIDDGY